MAEISNIPNNKVQVEDENLVKLKKLLSFLNENEDVQNVYDNADYEDEEDDE
jgi:transcriptional/translational regulatory protein YebC/TACO1